MAKAKNLKNTKNQNKTDFTFEKIKYAVVRFDRSAVLGLALDNENKKLTGNLIDEVNGKRYLLDATLTEEA